MHSANLHLRCFFFFFFFFFGPCERCFKKIHIKKIHTGANLLHFGRWCKYLYPGCKFALGCILITWTQLSVKGINVERYCFISFQNISITSSPKGNGRSPESIVPRSDVVFSAIKANHLKVNSSPLYIAKSSNRPLTFLSFFLQNQKQSCNSVYIPE